ncbi:MAG: hypothetical protein JSW72_04185 [Candidatus Bathyarchaeota archaeon]|nr:MAG: hypothetical protein JSW72_04185 [Candidatus Bathyarchaeota archaeon]
MENSIGKILGLLIGLLLLLSLQVLPGSTNFAGVGEATYYPNTVYSNVKSCERTPGDGNWTEPVVNTLGLYHDPPVDHGEIGVLEITESKLVYQVEVYGSGCVPPVNLTVNGITKEVQSYHDSEPKGNETLTFNIEPSKIITMHTTKHDNVSNHGFGIKWLKVYYVIALNATLDVDPDTLNLRSKGSWITSYLELPAGYEIQEINMSAILLNNTIVAEQHPMAVGDQDEDGIPDLMVKFDRAQVEAFIWNATNNAHLCEEKHTYVALTVNGELTGTNYTTFQGIDIIRVLCKE